MFTTRSPQTSPVRDTSPDRIYALIGAAFFTISGCIVLLAF